MLLVRFSSRFHSFTCRGYINTDSSNRNNPSNEKEIYAPAKIALLSTRFSLVKYALGSQRSSSDRRLQKEKVSFFRNGGFHHAINDPTMIFDRFYGSGKGEINLLQVFSRGMTSPKNFLPDSLESIVGDESDLPRVD